MNKKIKIVHIINISQLSGASVISLEILEHLSGEIYEKYIISGIDIKGLNEFQDRCKSSGITLILLKNAKRKIGFSDLLYFLELKNELKKHDFDIVHTNSSKPGLFGRIAAKWIKVPIILHTVHGIAYHRGQNPIKRLILYSLDLVGTMFCDHQVLVNTYYTKYYKWLPWVKSQTIKNGISVSNLLLNDSKSENKARSTVLFLARLENQKDPLTLLKAIKYLSTIDSNVLENVTFKFLGDGNLAGECKKFVIDNKIENYVSFPGWTSQKWVELLDCEFVCVPSKFEACGLVFIEAALCGKPSISTFTEGIPEVIVNNRTGLLCRVGDYETLAKKISTLLKDKCFAIKLGEEARKHVLKNYDGMEMKESYLKLYEMLYDNNVLNNEK